VCSDMLALEDGIKESMVDQDSDEDKCV